MTKKRNFFGDFFFLFTFKQITMYEENLSDPPAIGC